MVRVEAVGYQHQTDMNVPQANPVSGTKYEVLPTTNRVRIIFVAAKVVWTVQPTPLEVHITVDGVDLVLTVANPVSNTYYEFKGFDGHSEHGALGTLSYTDRSSFILEGKTVKVEAETTGGTVSNLTCRVKYAVLRP